MKSPYLRLMRFDKPIGIFLLLWPTLWALWIAGNGHPQWRHIIVFVLGVIIMRAAGCVINDLADHNIDGFVERTQHRPLVTGEVKVKHAWILFCLLCLGGFSLLFWLNWLAAGIAVVSLGLSILYPFSKRFLPFPQLLLGVAWYMGMLMAFAVEQHRIPPIAWLLYLSAIMWTISYDTQYAMVDRDDDRLIGVHSTAILFGAHDGLLIGCFQGIFIMLLAFVGYLAKFHLSYYFFLCLSSTLLIYQQFLVKFRTRDGYMKAFLNNHYVGLLVYIGILSAYS